MIRALTRGVAFLLIFLVSAIAARADDQPAIIRFGGVGVGFGLPYGIGLIAIAQVKGFVADQFKGTPTKLEWSYFTGTGPAINEAFSNRQIDFALYGSLPEIIAKANGIQTKMLLSGGGSHVYGAASVGRPIASIADLKGHSVTLQKATIMQWALIEMLEANGLSRQDVKLLDLKQPDQLAALSAGSVDAAFGSANLLNLSDKGVVKIFYASKTDPKAIWPESLLVSSEFEARYPDTTRRVVAGFVEAAFWLAQPQNHDEAVRIWSQSGIADNLLAKDFADEDLKSRFSPLLDPFILDRFRKGIAFAAQERLIRGGVDLNQWIAPQYLNAALQVSGHGQFWHPRGSSGSRPGERR